MKLWRFNRKHYLCTMNELITAVNDVIWSYVLIVALVGCGLWFTWRTKFVQFRMVGEMLRLLTESAVDGLFMHSLHYTYQWSVSGARVEWHSADTICFAARDWKYLMTAYRIASAGLEPVFHRSQLPEIEDELECWE